jgi:hypothetical protein
MFKRLAFLLIFILYMIPMSTANADSPNEKRFPNVIAVDVVAMEGHALGYLGMFLTNIEILTNPPHSYERSDFSLLVVNSYKIDEQISEVPTKDPGIIMVLAKKDGKSIKANAKFKGNGVYIGQITFPEAGSWDISIKAVRINHDGSVSNAEAVKTIEVVEGEAQPKDKQYLIYWVTTIAVTLIFLFVFWKKISLSKVF